MTRLFSSLFAAAALVLCTSALPAPEPVVGQPAPDFTLTLIGGGKVKLSEMRGKVVILNFWATWCGPCKREIPLLDAYYRKRQDRGLIVYAVATEDSLPPFQLRKLFAQIAYPQARSIRGPYRTLNGVPTNYVIGRDGRLRYADAGAFTLEQMNQLLVPLLNEPVPADVAAR
ncbi:TlpA family protein disulfide reductase [Sphingomonas canadensis]|uniref:TlpA family protein disulfide reductase n=1 Tax=Sphingomonas canadensis TaxID=1219257 RepID=A0ABW3H7U1_9SPHN|nr:TlpA disulfide reductase family protein [Sphingomonas canadensis]MCW3836797.1 TlpA family protein disulfide reductase [Sphingomonas canadensis]